MQRAEAPVEAWYSPAGQLVQLKAPFETW